MKALVTGADSGIGKSISMYLDSLGYDLILVARNGLKLDEVKGVMKNKATVVSMDLSVYDNCVLLHSKYRDIDILVNNAGFGLFGEFCSSDVDREMGMIDVNIRALHILMKLYLQDFVERDRGYILNVGSIAGFMPGPLMDCYYASKNYVVRISQGVREELRRRKSKVVISLLCPGPVKTNFDNVANVRFSLKGLDSDYVARYAVDRCLGGKFMIIPSFEIKCLRVVAKIVPDSVLVRFVYKMQRKKG